MSLGCAFKQQRKCDVASFASKNVVGAASRLNVHGFNARLLVNQRFDPRWLGKPEPVAAAKNNKFGIHRSDLCKMCGAKVFEAGASPAKAFSARSKYHAGADFFAADANPVRSITADGLHADDVGMKLHVEMGPM